MLLWKLQNSGFLLRMSALELRLQCMPLLVAPSRSKITRHSHRKGCFLFILNTTESLQLFRDSFYWSHIDKYSELSSPFLDNFAKGHLQMQLIEATIYILDLACSVLGPGCVTGGIYLPSGWVQVNIDLRILCSFLDHKLLPLFP